MVKTFIKFFTLFIFFNTLLFSSQNSDNLKKVTLQLQWLDQFQFAGYYMAKEKGFYKDVGLHVEFLPFKQNMNVVDEVISKRATFGISRSSLIIERNRGKNITLLAAILQSSPLVLLTTNLNIKSLKDFKSKKIMLDGNEMYSVLLQAMIYKGSISKEDVEIVQHSFNLNDLIDKKVDLISAYTSVEPFLLREKGIKYKIFDPRDYGFDVYEDILFTSDDELKNHHKRSEDFVDASLKGWKYAFENIEESVDIIFNKYNSQNKSKEALIYEAYELKKLAYFGIDKNNLGNINKNKIAKIFDIYNLLGLVNHKYPLDDNFVTKLHSHYNAYATQDEKNYLKNKKSIKMCVDPNKMPFEAIKYGKHIGMSADYINLVEHLVGVDINLVPTKSWSQSLNFIKNGKCDILSLAMSTPKREKFLKVTEAYLNSPLVIVTKKDQFFITDIDNILDKKIGIVKDYAIAELIKEKYPDINLVEVKNIDDGLRKVASGELFALIDNVTIIGYKIRKNYSDTLKISGQVDIDWNLGIGVRADDTILFNILNNVVKNIDEKSKNEIINKYSKVDYNYGFDYKLFWKIVAIFTLLMLFFIYRQYVLKKHNSELQKRVEQAVEETKIQSKHLEQQSRLAYKAEMLSMIAHQWRQPLGVISATAMGIELNLSLNKYDLSKSEEEKKFKEYLSDKLNNINKYTQYLSTTIDSFRTFFKQDEDKELVPITRPIQSAIELIEESFKKNSIKLNLNYVVDDAILMYENELTQVLLSITQNAEEQLVHLKKNNPQISISTTKKEKDYIITICDNAGGIDESIIDSIFDPYFSTKDEKNGSGLGLYMSKIMIEKHNGGKLHVKNSKDGACFTILLSS